MNRQQLFERLIILVKQDDFDTKSFDLIQMLSLTEAEKKLLKDTFEWEDFSSVGGFGEFQSTLVGKVIYPPIKNEITSFFKRVHSKEYLNKGKKVPLIYKFSMLFSNIISIANSFWQCNHKNASMNLT